MYFEEYFPLGKCLAGLQAQWMKILAKQLWQLEFYLPNPTYGRGRKLTSQSCLLTSMCAPWYAHTHTIIIIIKRRHFEFC